MIIKNDKKYRDDLVAICNYIKDVKTTIDWYDFINFVVSFEYYKVFYQNYHIIKDLIEYHDSHLNYKSDVNVYENIEKDEILDF